MENYKLRKFRAGSAMIMAIAIVTMLAIVGAVFLLMSRMDEAATSSVADYKALDNAVDSVIATIAAELKQDTPGVDPNAEYYDYPGDNDKWLANLEPYDDSGTYKWKQITDLFGDFNETSNQHQDIQPEIISENEIISVDTDGVPNNASSTVADADADGDGVADSKWVRLDNVSSSTGRPIYAAIRIIDNSGMINVNTAYQFDPTFSEKNKINGKYLSNINLMGLSVRNTDVNESDIEDLLDKRNIIDSEVYKYENHTAFNFNSIYKNSTPFDISDELEFRNRFLLNNPDIDTRLESWGGEFRKNTSKTPFEDLSEWNITVCDDGSLDPNYAYRHLATIYNVDRTIRPDGLDQFCVSDDANSPTPLNDAQTFFNYIITQDDFVSLDTTDKQFLAQISANLVDMTDSDCDVSTVNFNYNDYYGIEKPLIMISELVTRQEVDSTDPNITLGLSFAIELSKYYHYNDTFDEWYLEVTDKNGNSREEVTLTRDEFRRGGGRYYVLVFNDPNAPFDANDIKFTDSPYDGAEGIPPDVVLDWSDYDDEDYATDPNLDIKYDVYLGTDKNDVTNAKANDPNSDPNNVYQGRQTGTSFDPTPDLDKYQEYFWRVDILDGNDVLYTGDVLSFKTGDPNANFLPEIEIQPDDWILLSRKTGTTELLVDSVQLPSWLISNSNSTISFRRDIHWSSILKKLWDDNPASHTLGHRNGFRMTPLNDYPPIPLLGSWFHNIGDIGNTFKKSHYDIAEFNWDESPLVNTRIENSDHEFDVRVDLADPNIQQIFKYITRMRGKDNETRIKGRININTAPWYVLAQLPWVSERDKSAFNNSAHKYDLAKAIIDYRDKLNNYTDRSSQINDEKITVKKTTRNSGEYSQQYDILRDFDWENLIREEKGFESIGELCNITDSTLSYESSIAYYAIDGISQAGFPDLSFNWRSRRDGMTDDFEERNLIFSRISDLVTVRSDVFTAYILVRLGTDGPQRRVIAILDRSKVTPNSGKVQVIAKYPVPDPR